MMEGLPRELGMGRGFACLLCLLLLSQQLQLSGAASKPGAVFKKVDAAIMAAYLPEYQSILSHLTGRLRNYTFGGRLFTTGVITDGKKAKKSAVVVMMGIGMTNAAMTTQMTILLFQPDYIFNTGIAGGMDPKNVRIGDVVVAQTYIDPDMKKLIRPGFDGHQELAIFVDPGTDFPDKFYSEPGKPAGYFGVEYPPNYNWTLPMPNKTFLASLPNSSTVSMEFSIPMEVEVLREVADTFKVPTPPTMFDLPASSYIYKTAAKVLPTIKLENSFGNSSLPYQPVAKVVSRCQSSNTFLDNPDMRKQGFSLYNVTCTEMEGHAILHVCLSNKVQCAIVRSISDLAGGEPGQPGESELGTFFAVAAHNTGLVVTALLLAL